MRELIIPLLHVKILHHLTVFAPYILSYHILFYLILPNVKCAPWLNDTVGIVTSNLYFSSFKIKNLIKVKDTVPRSLRPSVVYKFNSAECNSAYVAETSRHLSTRVREHLSTDENSNIFKHLKTSDKCKKACKDSCFIILHTASTNHQLKMKEALHILWEKSILNKQAQHIDVSLNF